MKGLSREMSELDFHFREITLAVLDRWIRAAKACPLWYHRTSAMTLNKTR